jgi:hypothetical protein
MSRNYRCICHGFIEINILKICSLYTISVCPHDGVVITSQYASLDAMRLRFFLEYDHRAFKRPV